MTSWLEEEVGMRELPTKSHMRIREEDELMAPLSDAHRAHSTVRG